MKKAFFRALILSLSILALIVSCKKEKPLATTKDIIAFVFTVANNPSLSADVTGVISGSTITVPLPSNTVATALKPTITHTGASVNPASNAVNNFSTTPTYTVTATDGSTKTYTIVLDFGEENFLTPYLTTTGFSQRITNAVNAGDYEFGTFFTPTTNGTLTKIKVKIPDANAALRVTIWRNGTPATVLRTETVNVASANTEFTFDIADIDLQKNIPYVITMNGNDWYDRSRTDGFNITYPITTGNIQVNAYKYAVGTMQQIPTFNQVSYYAGDLSFDFKRTE
jgi:hypothetical protein